MVHDFPNIGDELYLMHKKIIVTKIIKEFHLVQIRYLEDPIEFYIDIFALRKKPDYTNSVSLGVLRGCGS